MLFISGFLFIKEPQRIQFLYVRDMFSIFKTCILIPDVIYKYDFKVPYF